MEGGMSRPNEKPPGVCECWDTGCPCAGYCSRKATTVLARTDYCLAVIPMCERCAEDAMASGLFVTEEEEA